LPRLTDQGLQKVNDLAQHYEVSAEAVMTLLFAPAGSLFDPVIPMSVFIQINHRDWSECAETSNERTLHVQISAVSCKSNRVRRVGQDVDQPRGKP
jgi:hypothetical protein